MKVLLVKRSVQLLSLLGILGVTSCATGSHQSIGPEMKPLVGPPKGDSKLIQGAWVVTYDEVRKTSLPRAGAIFYFSDNRHWISGNKGHEWFSINEQTYPKSIDFYDYKTPTIRGIYKIEGSQLTLCTADPGAPRPREFKTSRFTGDILTFTRRK